MTKTKTKTKTTTKVRTASRTRKRRTIELGPLGDALARILGDGHAGEVVDLLSRGKLADGLQVLFHRDDGVEASAAKRAATSAAPSDALSLDVPAEKVESIRAELAATIAAAPPDAVIAPGAVVMHVEGTREWEWHATERVDGGTRRAVRAVGYQTEAAARAAADGWLAKSRARGGQ